MNEVHQLFGFAFFNGEAMINHFWKPNALVLSGGGALGYATVGALSGLTEGGIKLNNVRTVVGTSIGSVIGLFLCCGFSIMELEQLILRTNMQDVIDSTNDYRINDIDMLLEEYGVDDGSSFNAFLCDCLLSKNFDPRITFSELLSNYQRDLHVVAANVTNLSSVYFSAKSHPNLRVIDAVRMSISLPVRFTSPIFENGRMADGGLKDNFAIQYTEKLMQDLFPGSNTFIVGVSTADDSRFECQNLYEYLINVVKCCLTNTIYPSIVQNHGPSRLIVNMQFDGIRIMDFGLTDQQKKQLVDDGKEKAHSSLLAFQDLEKTYVAAKYATVPHKRKLSV